MESSTPPRLNLGAGPRRIPGYVSVDIDKKHNPDICCDVLNLQDHFEPNSVAEILAIHLIEHIEVTLIPQILKSWYSLLIPGGHLAIECPNLKDAAQAILKDPLTSCLPGFDPNEDKRGGMAVRQLYGRRVHGSTYMHHQWGYTPESMLSILSQFGFAHITFEDPRYKRANPRGMRAVAYKPE